MVRAKASIPAEAIADVLHAVVAGDSEKKLRTRLASKFGDQLVNKALAYCHYRSLLNFGFSQWSSSKQLEVALSF